MLIAALSARPTIPLPTSAWLLRIADSTELYTERAQQLLRAWRPGQPPLFLYLAWQAVHEPMEAPERYVRPYADPASPMHIGDFSRRMYAGMVAAMDEGLGNLTATLRATGLLKRTILVHTNDNGGMSGTYGMRCCKCDGLLCKCEYERDRLQVRGGAAQSADRDCGTCAEADTDDACAGEWRHCPTPTPLCASRREEADTDDA